ncbi:hypothetical protein T492DRAFT_169148 [Pavlovales sp. CCMP2436]|nr:hypothetical protein T492DRAFT_169148 [Pavlovales sp. CCMP2436]
MLLRLLILLLQLLLQKKNLLQSVWRRARGSSCSCGYATSLETIARPEAARGRRWRRRRKGRGTRRWSVSAGGMRGGLCRLWPKRRAEARFRYLVQAGPSAAAQCTILKVRHPSPLLLCKCLEIRPSPDRSPPDLSVEKHSDQGTLAKHTDTVPEGSRPPSPPLPPLVGRSLRERQ